MRTEIATFIRTYMRTQSAMEAKFVTIQRLFKTLAQHHAHRDMKYYILVARLQSSLLGLPSCQAMCHYPLQLWCIYMQLGTNQEREGERERVAACINVCLYVRQAKPTVTTLYSCGVATMNQPRQRQRGRERGWRMHKHSTSVCLYA